MVTNALTLHDIIRAAEKAVTKNDWDYLVGGAETETSLKRNRLALDRYALRSRVLRDVSAIKAGTHFLGVPLRIPVLMAPIGSLQVFSPGGGKDVAEAARDFGTMMILSSACQPDYQTVAEVDAAKIYQLYVMGDDDWLMGIVEKVQALGYNGFCLTVDTQVYSRRERDLIKGYIPGSGSQPVAIGQLPNDNPFYFQSRLTWETVAKIKDRFDIPLILKGIATGEDAAMACEAGVDVVYVSNHGGRQLDQGIGTLDMLPEVVQAVQGRVPVVFDGGVMRGTDIAKALALGADVVGVGRLMGLAMAAGGRAGVVRMLEILEHELVTSLALMGVTDIADLDPECLRPAQPVAPTHVLSSFPFLEEGY